MSLILGLETSCDETAAAVVRNGTQVLSNVVATQHDLHATYGGVVPEIASRAHLERLYPTVHAAFDQAGIRPEDLDAVAVGNRPGLVGSLIVGVNAAKALAWSLGVPLLGVHHVHAHLYAPLLSPHTPADTISQSPAVYPALGLVVSGGHTSMYRVESPLTVTRLGRTIDDAVGEAYDKAAVLLQAGYPGGPNIDRLAANGNPTAHDLPRSMLGKDSLDFSFSGLKTALLYKVRGHPVGRGSSSTFERDIHDLSQTQRIDLAASFQQAVVDTLIRKLERALEHLSYAPVALLAGGGVTANSALRPALHAFGKQHNLPIHLPPLAYCVDNAAMIAGLAHHQRAAGQHEDLDLAVEGSVRD